MKKLRWIFPLIIAIPSIIFGLFLGEWLQIISTPLFATETRIIVISLFFTGVMLLTTIISIGFVFQKTEIDLKLIAKTEKFIKQFTEYIHKFAPSVKSSSQTDILSRQKTTETIMMKCNICGNDEFIDMNTRKNVKCKQCGSLERTRLLWMYLQNLNIEKHTKILHLAPERGIYQELLKRIDHDNYIIANIEPERYAFVEKCEKIDLCKLDNQPSFEYDFIIHSHVLEHTPCNIAYTLFHLHRMLKKNGRHICIIPFVNGKYDESFQDLSDEQRHKRFGQFDHVRRYGSEDIAAHLGKIINIPVEFDATKYFSTEDLRSANIPEGHWKGFHTSTVLNLKRNDMKFIA